MPSGSQEIGTPLAEVTEKQGLMTPTSVDDSLDLEPRVSGSHMLHIYYRALPRTQTRNL